MAYFVNYVLWLLGKSNIESSSKIYDIILHDVVSSNFSSRPTQVIAQLFDLVTMIQPYFHLLLLLSMPLLSSALVALKDDYVFIVEL